MPESIYSKAAIRAALMPAPSRLEDEPIWSVKSPQELPDRLKSMMAKNWKPAAVLIALIERDAGLAVLLTQRAATLRDHAGQISFPGGRAEPADGGPRNTAMREAREEIGLDPAHVEFVGYLPDHYVGTGFRVTPVVAFVKPQFELSLDSAEVHDAFEVPLEFLFNRANQQLRARLYGDNEVHFHSIQFESRHIWGATAGMLVTLQRAIEAKSNSGLKLSMSAKIQDLLAIMRRLRSPEGCPWDRAQTSKTIAPSTLEEAFEVVDAIESGDAAHLCEELGDLQFQIVFHAQMASERGEFDFDDVVGAICDKLTRRHPHVFAQAASPTIEQQSHSWEQIKALERQAAVGSAAISHLHGVPLVLPALQRAEKLSRRAARVGFDWPRAEQTAAKVQEELDEVAAAMRMQAGAERDEAVKEEVGDLLFAVANLARKLQIDAESALRAANLKFERRFLGMESLSRSQGLAFDTATLVQQEALWQEVKRRESTPK